MKSYNDSKKLGKKFFWVIFLILFIIFIKIITNNGEPEQSMKENILDDSTFKIISSSENKDLANILISYARMNNINLSIDYAGTLEIMDILNGNGNYDAVWTSNSIWLYMLNDNVKIKNSKSTSINPVVFGIKKSKAEELGFVDNDVYMKNILKEIKNGKLKFNMSSATQTNTGATAYLGFLSTLADNPEVLTKEILEGEELKTDLKELFTGVVRSSGSDEFLEEMFLNGDYEAVVTYETSIININKKLEAQGDEPLYIIYAKDGVSISDSPFAYIDNGIDYKQEQFEVLQRYILSNEGQEKLAKTGRRVWYGGINTNADTTIFNPNWGIDTTKYIVPVKYPSTDVIKEALGLYQTELRKPIHTVFCLDYSGSMYGEGNEQLVSAMEYILDKDEASKNLLQFSEKDKITIILFDNTILKNKTTNNGLETQDLLTTIKSQSTVGATNIYLAANQGLEILKDENLEDYNTSIILMTDGNSNYGYYNDLYKKYINIKKDIPIFSIMFGSASEEQLNNIATLTNAKVFDGRTDLIKAFKEVRGYN